jgi:uncharacterized protein YecT (DUF1311 family)
MQGFSVMRTHMASVNELTGLLAALALLTSFVEQTHAQSQPALVAAADREMTQAYATCLAQSNGVTLEMINCMLAETRRQDARLNENFKKLISELGTERKKALVEAQRAWINFRDTNCGFYADPEGGSAARMAANECILNSTVDCAKELQLLTSDR